MKFKYFAVLALLTTLVACNPTLPPPPPGWNLELRAGTTNIDRSFFQSIKPDATRSSNDATRFAQLREAIIKKVPNLNLGSALASGFTPNPKASNTNTRETVALALSLFMAVSKDGSAPKSDLSFVYSGPEGAYDKPITYPAGNAWIASPLVIPKGNGQYIFSSTLQDGTLAGNVSVNFEDQTQWLPLPLEANNPNGFGSSMGQYGNVFVAHWQTIPNVQSYIGLIYDRTDKKYVDTFLTKSTSIETQEFISVQDHTYSLDLIATTVDLTKDSTKTYGTSPDSMRSSISSFSLASFQPPSLNVDQTRVSLLAKPNQTSESILMVSNNGYAPLGYTATISGTGLEITAGATGILLGSSSRELHVKGTCANADLTGTITITSNDPNNKTKTVPVVLECDVPISATLELAKLSQNADIRFMQNSPDKKKVATSDGMDIIVWDAVTGAAIRKITPARNSSPVDNSISSIAWHPGSNLLAVGGKNLVTIFDVNTGLSTVTAAPSGAIQSIDWNGDGSQFVVGSSANALIYNGSSGGLVRLLDVPNINSFSNPVEVAWSKSSGKLATSAGDRITIWDTTTGTEINHYVGALQPFQGKSNVSWNPAGDTLVFRTLDGTNLGVWVVANTNLERTIPIEPPNANPGQFDTVGQVKWSPLGSKIALVLRKISNGNVSFSARIWDASIGVFQSEFLVADGAQYINPLLEWSSNGESLLTQKGHLAVSWNAITGVQGLTFGFVPAAMASIRLNGNGTQLIVASNPFYNTGILSLMDIPSGNTLQNLKISQQVRLVDWRKDVDQVMTVLSSGGIIQSYTSTNWTPLTTYEGYAPSVYSPDGTKLAVSLNDYKVRILDSTTGAVLQTITVDTCAGCSSLGILGLQWSPDNSKIVVVSPIGSKIKVYAIASGNLNWEKVLNVNFDIYANNLRWSPDGKRILAETMFFDASTGDAVQILEPDPINGIIPRPIAWSPDSRYLLTQKANLMEIRNATSGRKVLSVFELPASGFAMPTLNAIADWNAQSNRIAVTDGQSSVYIYKFSQP